MGHAVRHFSEYEPVKKKYIFLVSILYAVSVLVFIILYTKGTPIDLNARHLKLTSFLLYPVFFELLLKRFKRAWVLVLVGMLGVFALGNHIRLVRKWTQGTSITRSGFSLFKQDMPLGLKSKLDSLVKTKTVVISPYGSRYAVDNQLILPILSETDIRPDLVRYGYPTIFTDSLGNH
jgi:hypothetical protein